MGLMPVCGNFCQLSRLPGRLSLWALALVCTGGWATGALAGEVLVLGSDVQVRQRPSTESRSIGTAQPGDFFDIAGRKGGRGASSYFLDEQGEVWVKVQGAGDSTGFIRTDLVAINREEFPSPRGKPLLIVNLRPTGTGSSVRDLWLVAGNWESTRRLGSIVGKPVWASGGEWFIFQKDSNRPVKDPSVDRMVELIVRVGSDGETATTLAAGSWPVLNESRREVYFYRDVDEQGEPIPPGLFAVGVDGTNLRAVFLLPEKHSFWKEDGDFFAQAPPPVMQAGNGHITLRAFDRAGHRLRFTVTLDGQLIERKPD